MLTTLTLTELMLLVFAREMFLADGMTSILEGAVSSKVALFTAGKTAFSRAVFRIDSLAVALELGFTRPCVACSPLANLMPSTCSGFTPLLKSCAGPAASRIRDSYSSGFALFVADQIHLIARGSKSLCATDQLLNSRTSTAKQA